MGKVRFKIVGNSGNQMYVIETVQKFGISNELRMGVLHDIAPDEGLILETAALLTCYDVNLTRMNSLMPNFDVSLSTNEEPLCHLYRNQTLRGKKWVVD